MKEKDVLSKGVLTLLKAALEKAENIIRGLTAVFTGSELTGEEKDELYRRITMIYVESKEKTFIKA